MVKCICMRAFDNSNVKVLVCLFLHWYYKTFVLTENFCHDNVNVKNCTKTWAEKWSYVCSYTQPDSVEMNSHRNCYLQSMQNGKLLECAYCFFFLSSLFFSFDISKSYSGTHIRFRWRRKREKIGGETIHIRFSMVHLFMKNYYLDLFGVEKWDVCCVWRIVVWCACMNATVKLQIDPVHAVSIISIHNQPIFNAP